MAMPKIELLNLEEVAALLGKSIDETSKILENAKVQVADKDGAFDLYDHRVITDFIIKNPKVMIR